MGAEQSLANGAHPGYQNGLPGLSPAGAAPAQLVGRKRRATAQGEPGSGGRDEQARKWTRKPGGRKGGSKGTGGSTGDEGSSEPEQEEPTRPSQSGAGGANGGGSHGSSAARKRAANAAAEAKFIEWVRAWHARATACVPIT